MGIILEVDDLVVVVAHFSLLAARHHLLLRLELGHRDRCFTINSLELKRRNPAARIVTDVNVAHTSLIIFAGHGGGFVLGLFAPNELAAPTLGAVGRVGQSCRIDELAFYPSDR